MYLRCGNPHTHRHSESPSMLCSKLERLPLSRRIRQCVAGLPAPDRRWRFACFGMHPVYCWAALHRHPDDRDHHPFATVAQVSDCCDTDTVWCSESLTAQPGAHIGQSNSQPSNRMGLCHRSCDHDAGGYRPADEYGEKRWGQPRIPAGHVLSASAKTRGTRPRSHRWQCRCLWRPTQIPRMCVRSTSDTADRTYTASRAIPASQD